MRPSDAVIHLCFACERRAVAGWLDLEGNFTPVCRHHQWIAVAACGSAQAKFVRLDKDVKKLAG